MSSRPDPVVVFSNGYGDHLLVLPALRALSSLNGGRLRLVCMPGARELFFRDVALSDVVEAPMRRAPTGGREFDAAGIAAGLGSCNCLYSLNPWHSGSMDELLERLSPARSYGFYEEFTDTIKTAAGRHAVDLAFSVPRHIAPGLRVEGFAAAPSLSREAERFAERLAAMTAPHRLLVVHGETDLRKEWPLANFSRLITTFLAERDDFIVFDVGKARSVLGDADGSERAIFCGGLPLGHAMALVARADLFLGVDSSMLHAADAFRVPGVGIFGPTDPHEFGFRFGPHRHAVSNGCMSGVGEDEVFVALQGLLRETDAKSA